MDPAEIRRNQEMLSVVEKYNEKHRPKSLMEEYQSKYMQSRVDKDDPSKRKFDREKDLGNRQYDDSKRTMFISKSQGPPLLS